MRIRHIYLSEGHNFFGHYGEPPGEHPAKEVSEVECVAGRGLRGDRFFDYKEDYKGQITFFSFEVYQQLMTELSVGDKPPSVFRRNVITEGQDLNELVDQEFEIQGVSFFGVCECAPCQWMNEAFGSGAEAFLKGRGGLRARILTSGWLRVESET